MTNKYVTPSFGADAFHCPHCGVYAHQEWYDDVEASNSRVEYHQIDIEEAAARQCGRCQDYVLWFDQKMLYPAASIAPMPIDDMPDDVKADFLEARGVANASPRSAAALLRLALQKLMPHLGEKGKNINDDIGSLVKKGLPVRIQQALDIVRVIGNSAVHPGGLDIKDDDETALALFDLLNLIVEEMITRPRQLDELYGKLPDSKKEQIAQRDGKS